MTPIEFKAWFQGFTEQMSGAPNKQQWERIKKRVSDIDGLATTERVFIDRYWPTYFHGVTVPYVSPGSWSYYTPNIGSSFSSNTAMYSLGIAEAAQIIG